MRRKGPRAKELAAGRCNGLSGGPVRMPGVVVRVDGGGRGAGQEEDEGDGDACTGKTELGGRRGEGRWREVGEPAG